jgi:hypothetical protein
MESKGMGGKQRKDCLSIFVPSTRVVSFCWHVPMRMGKFVGRFARSFEKFGKRNAAFALSCLKDLGGRVGIRRLSVCFAILVPQVWLCCYKNDGLHLCSRYHLSRACLSIFRLSSSYSTKKKVPRASSPSVQSSPQKISAFTHAQLHLFPILPRTSLSSPTPTPSPSRNRSPLPPSNQTYAVPNPTPPNSNAIPNFRSSVSSSLYRGK